MRERCGGGEEEVREVRRVMGEVRRGERDVWRR